MIFFLDINEEVFTVSSFIPQSLSIHNSDDNKRRLHGLSQIRKNNCKNNEGSWVPLLMHSGVPHHIRSSKKDQFHVITWIHIVLILSPIYCIFMLGNLDRGHAHINPHNSISSLTLWCVTNTRRSHLFIIYKHINRHKPLSGLSWIVSPLA